MIDPNKWQCSRPLNPNEMHAHRKVDGDGPAFPGKSTKGYIIREEEKGVVRLEQVPDGGLVRVDDPNKIKWQHVFHPGMTIRAHIATEAMKGILGNQKSLGEISMEHYNDLTGVPRHVAQVACQFADALIAELNHEQGEQGRGGGSEPPPAPEGVLQPAADQKEDASGKAE